MPTPQSDLLVDLRERMVRIETKLDERSTAQVILRTDVDDHEERITKLEGNYRLLASIGAILLALVTFFQEAITNALGI